MNNQINIPITVDAKDLPYELDKAVSVVERATKGMSKSLAESVKQSGFHYKSLQEAYSTTVRHAELLAVTLGEDSAAYKDAVVQAQNYATKMQGVQNAIHNTNTTIGNGTGQLNMAMAQLTREAPAFTYSMTTGFLAISNNIPILVDEINRLKIANQGLAASGQATTSVFSSVVGALFSWQTALSVGVTVLTIFGARIYDSISSMSDSAKETSFLQVKTNALTNSIIDQTGELYKRNAELRISLGMAENNTLKDEEQIKRNDKLIQQSKDQLFAGNFRTKQIATETGMKTVLNALNQDEINAINSNIKSLKDQNAVLQVNVDLQKKIDALKPKKEKSDKFDRAGFKAMQERLAMFKATYFASELLQESINAQADSVPEIDKIKGPFDELANSIGIADIKFEIFMRRLPKMVDLSKEMAEAVENLITNALVNTAAALGDALITGKDVGEQIMGSLLGSVGSAMIEFGKLAIAAGVAALGIKFALQSLNPALAIAGGIALVALGAAVSAKGASISKNMSNGGGGGGGYTQGQPFNGSPYQFAPTSSYLDVSGLVRGQDIVISTNNTNRNNKRVKR